LFAARLLEEQELWPQAKVLFRRAIELAPDDGKPLYYREYAGALSRRGEDAETREVLGIVLRFDPQNLDLQLALAGSLQRLGQDAEALQVYQEALELAKALGRDGITPGADPGGKGSRQAWPSREERVLEAIRERFPTPQRTADPATRALGALAAFYHHQKRDDLAVPLWEKAIAATPDDAATAFGLARSYDAVGAWLSAVDYYKRAIELNRGSLDYRLTLADRYYDNDMVFQAINLWREVVVVRPTLVEARLKLAAAYARLEQYPEAQREYERVLQLEPTNQPANEAILRLRGRVSGG
jgi:tetratricopeptide (TPR) repeat protein